MVAYDFLMLAILAGAVLWGVYKGMAWQVASFVSLVASYFVSMQLREPVANALGLQPPWGTTAAMLGLYMATSLIVWVVFSMINKTLKNFELKDWDRQVGAGLGLVKGVLLCIIVTMFAVALTKDDSRQQIVQSKSGFYITKVIHNLHGVMPAEVNQVVGPFIERYNQRINGQNPDWFAETGSGTGLGSGGGDGVTIDPANFNLQTEFQNFQNNVQNQIQNKIQNEVQNQAGQFQNFVNQTIENPQNAQSNWQQYSGQYQPPQQPSYYPPQMNIPSPQQQGGSYIPQYSQPPQQTPYPMQNGQPYYPAQPRY
ncbi:Colicin V production protein [Bremerella volcania]|uniref:Colicin V production protein n=1 Tax=Bremerella volcania TaxID=2527984 RepID=A0A518C660_9BACT|nr:CvpA family protein [Bremerella volcania]QDU74707.1 Colicin V production protein [Bremerella volcania]